MGNIMRQEYFVHQDYGLFSLYHTNNYEWYKDVLTPEHIDDYREQEWFLEWCVENNIIPHFK